MQGIAFCSSLLGADNRTSNFLEVESAALIALCDSNHRGDESVFYSTESGESLAVVLHDLYASNDELDQCTASATCRVHMEMMSFIVQQCQPWQTQAVKTILKVCRAKLILKSLRGLLDRPRVLLHTVEFVQRGYLPDWWDVDTSPAFLANSQAGNCLSEEVCSKSLDALRVELASDFSSFVLTAAWHSNHSLQNSETCRRLLDQLRRHPSSGQDQLCSYNANHETGQRATVPSAEVQRECDELRTQIQSEINQRSSLEAQLAHKEELLQQERLATKSIDEYLQVAHRDCFETSKALASAKERYRELAADSNRRVRDLDARFREGEMAYRADLLARETDLENRLDEAWGRLKESEEELRRERDDRARLTVETESSIARSHQEVDESSHLTSTG